VTGIRDRLTSTRAALRLSPGEFTALGLAALAVVLAFAVFAAMLEDVLGNDGMALHDQRFLGSILDHRSPSLTTVATAVTMLGRGAVLFPMAVAAAIALWLLRAKIAEAVAPLLSLGASTVTIALVKAAVGRTRPPADVRLVDEKTASFPSGHAGNSTALCVSIGIVLALVILHRPIFRLLALFVSGAVPFAIGLSRLELGVHWPSDVIAGWSIGIVCAVVITTAMLLIARIEPDSSSRSWRNRALRILGSQRRIHPASTGTASPNTTIAP
jgi:membrane-associated phospholipid phosphatase